MEHEALNLEAFNAGRFVRSNDYNHFLPEYINRQWQWQDPVLNELLEKASTQLAQLNALARFVRNVDLYIHLHVTKESVVSSRIEGTQTRMGEALLGEEEIAYERRKDWNEVQNYTKALNQAIAQLEQLPISSRLLCQTHQVLLSGVRGEHKNPGEFRRSQNWIGGSKPSDALFVPPSPEWVPNLMGDLEKFLHNEAIHVPKLIRIGIAHYQFETIHPFLDGNGRIGRLLITLYLISTGLLSKPLLYLSTFFEQDKFLYYDKLTLVRQKHDMLSWLRYFLHGVAETSEQAATNLQAILNLQEEAEKILRQHAGKRLNNALQLLDRLFTNPYVRIKDVQQLCDLTPRTAGNLVLLFEAAGLLEEQSGQARNRLYVFARYLALFEPSK